MEVSSTSSRSSCPRTPVVPARQLCHWVQRGSIKGAYHMPHMTWCSPGLPPIQRNEAGKAPKVSVTTARYI
eukprot:1139807-Pelagomonas_calceolata.AAC.1